MDRRQYSTLVEALKAVPDPRQARGRRHTWWLILTLIVGALASGQLNGRAIVQWVREHHEALVGYLQPTRPQLPSEATLRRALRQVDLTALQAILAQVAYEVTPGGGKIEQVEGAGEVEETRSPIEIVPPLPCPPASPVPPPADAPLAGVAVDGKTVRGVGRAGGALSLVSLVQHGSGHVLAQQAITDSEQATVPQLLAGCDLTQCVVTLDALHTERTLAAQSVAQGGHYLMVVKGNQPSLRADIALLWQLPPWQAVHATPAGDTHCTVEKRHGRLERRLLASSTALNAYLDWPAVQQVLRREVRCICLKTGEVREETTYAITSLPPQLADAAQLETFWRGHWTIENRLHYVRDVTLAEDACRIRTGNAPHALAAFRNAIISLFRARGWSFITDAIRHYGAAPDRVLRLLGALP